MIDLGVLTCYINVPPKESHVKSKRSTYKNSSYPKKPVSLTKQLSDSITVANVCGQKNCKSVPEKIKHEVHHSDVAAKKMVASKFLFDEGEKEGPYNGEWALVASLDVDQLNQLEKQFLDAIVSHRN